MKTKRNSENSDGENEMKIACEPDEMTAMTYQNHRLGSAPVLEPTTAKYLLDFLYFTRDDEQFRFYKKVSKSGEKNFVLDGLLNKSEVIGAM